MRRFPKRRAPNCTSASGAGSNAQQATGQPSTRKSSATTSSRPTSTASRSAPLDEDPRAIGREAAERLGKAGRRAFIRSDAPAGVNLISRAVALLPPDDPLRVELVPNVRVVQGMGGDMSWADRVLTEAVEAAATTGDRRLAAHALVQRGLLRLFTESEVTPSELIDSAERSIAVFEELGDELGLARAWRLTAQAHYLGAPRRDSARMRRSARLSTPAVPMTSSSSERSSSGSRSCSSSGPLLHRRLPTAAGNCSKTRPETGYSRCTSLAHSRSWSRCRVTKRRRTYLIARGQRVMQELGEWIWIYSWHYAAICLWQGDPAAAEARASACV